MLDFPNSPVTGQQFGDWIWDGVKWTVPGAATGGGGGGGDVDPYLPTAGGTMTGPLVTTATRATVTRAEQDRWADRANVLDFGADPTQLNDAAPGINAALATGRAVYMPKGNYQIRSAINLGSGSYLYGDGRGFTMLFVDQTFSSTALGVIVLTGAEYLSPIVEDLSIMFSQPPDTVTTANTASAIGATTVTVASAANISVNYYAFDMTNTAAIGKLATVTAIAGNVLTLSAPVASPGVAYGDSLHFGPSRANYQTLANGGTSGVGGTGVKYPPAIYSNGSGRYKIRRLLISACWDGIRNPGLSVLGGGAGQPGWIEEVEIGALNCGIYVGQSRDFFHINGYHFWAFGTTGLNAQAIQSMYIWDGQTVALDIGGDGGCNGVSVVDFTTQGQINISQGASATWAEFTNLMLDGPNALINMLAGQWIQITNSYSGGIPPSGTATGKARINLSSGTLIITNFFSANNSPIITVTGGVLRLTGGQLMMGVPSVPIVTCSGGAEMSIIGTILTTINTAGAWTQPVINHTSTGKCIFMNNAFRDTSPGDVGGLVITNDSAPCAVSNNAWNGWSWNPPGILGQYGFSANRVTQGTVNLVAFGGHAADLHLDSSAVSQRSLVYMTNGSTRWSVYANAAAEGGSNAGSDFYISRYSDSGGLLGSPISITRSTGTVAIATGGLTVSGTSSFAGGIGFHGATPVGQATVTGSRGGNAALASLLTTLAATGLIVDGTSA